MYNKKYVIVLITLFTHTSLFALSQPRIAIIGFSNLTTNSNYDIITSSANENLELSFKRIKKYSLIKLDTPFVDTNINQIMFQNKLDYLVYGKVTLKDGDLIFNLKVYDSTKGQNIVDITSPPSSLFDSFSTIDNLVTSAIENMIGSHIAYGYVTIQIEGIEKYYILIDDIDFEISKNEPIKLVEGDHHFTVIRKANETESVIVKNNFVLQESQILKLFIIFKSDFDTLDRNKPQQKVEISLNDFSGSFLGFTQSSTIKDVIKAIGKPSREKTNYKHSYYWDIGGEQILSIYADKQSGKIENISIHQEYGETKVQELISSSKINDSRLAFIGKTKTEIINQFNEPTFQIPGNFEYIRNNYGKDFSVSFLYTGNDEICTGISIDWVK